MIEDIKTLQLSHKLLIETASVSYIQEFHVWYNIFYGKRFQPEHNPILDSKKNVVIESTRVQQQTT